MSEDTPDLATYNAETDSFLECGSPNFGAWCKWCGLPSAGKLPLVEVGPSGATVQMMLTFCTDCERWLPVQKATF